MRNFVEAHAEGALEQLHDYERGPSEEEKCAQCKKVTEVWYRCRDCVLPPTVCQQCLLDAHAHNPFHSVEDWHPSRRFWDRKLLTSLDVIIKLGHGREGCDKVTVDPRNMQIVSEAGVHGIKVQFCECKDAETQLKVPDATQLLRAGFWPASWDTPQTAFTIRVLESFTMASNQCHTSAHDFYATLRLKTNFVRPKDVPVRGQNLQTDVSY